MTEQRKRQLILGLILLAFLLIIIWVIYFLFSGSEESVPEIVVDTTVVVTEEVVDTVPDNPTISEEELETEREVRDTSADVISLSKTFVERYGSYSNEANFANLTDVLTLMSASFADETENFIENAVAPEEYYGVTTKVITVTVENEGEITATLTLTTQREEAVESPRNTSVKYQEITLTFVKEGGVWKVDSATWL